MKSIKNIFIIILRDIFIAAYVLFIVLTFLELIKPKLVTNYFNLSYGFVVLIVLGYLVIILNPLKDKKRNKIKILDQIIIILFSILIGILIFHLTFQLGLIGILIGIAAFIICYFFINLNLKS